MQKTKHRDLYALHSAVMLFGAAGLFTRFIDGGAWVIVSGRTLFAALALLVYAIVSKNTLRIARADYLAFAGCGLLLSGHWWSFFHAIEISSVALGLLGFAVFPVFVMLLEPLVTRERATRNDFFLIVVILFGLVLVLPEYRLQNAGTLGVLWGVVSALLFALLVLMNRRLSKYAAANLGFWQNAIAALVLAPLGWPLLVQSSSHDWFAIILLGCIFTALAHALFISSLRSIAASKAAMIVALEPVYGIAFAGVLFAEWPGTRTLIGGAILLLASGLASLPKATLAKPKRQ